MRTPARTTLAVVILGCLSASPAPAQKPPSPSDARLRASVLTARDDLLAKYRNAPVEKAQEAFRAFWKYYNETVRDLRSRFANEPYDDQLLQRISGIDQCLEQPLLALDRSRDPRMAALKKTYASQLKELREWRRCGFDFTNGEGDWYLRDDPGFIAATAAQLPLGELGEYAAFRGREDRQRLTEDAGLLVPWDAIRRRLIRWESFAQRHPTLPETAKEVWPEAHRMLGWYLFGLDNTPTYENYTLNRDVKASYARFIKENTSSSFHSLIAGVYAIDKRHDFSPSDELVAFLRARLTNPDLERDLQFFERHLRH